MKQSSDPRSLLSDYWTDFTDNVTGGLTKGIDALVGKGTDLAVQKGTTELEKALGVSKEEPKTTQPGTNTVIAPSETEAVLNKVLPNYEEQPPTVNAPPAIKQENIIMDKIRSIDPKIIAGTLTGIVYLVTKSPIISLATGGASWFLSDRYLKPEAQLITRY